MIDRIINEYGAHGRMRTVRGNQCLREDLPQDHLVHCRDFYFSLGVMTSCNLVRGYHWFRGVSCFHLSLSENGGHRFLQTVSDHLPDYKVS
jgi:hypothetical protein